MGEYGLMKSTLIPPVAIMIAFCVSLEDLNGVRLQVLPKVDATRWEAVYERRSDQQLPDPDGNMWSPSFTGGKKNSGEGGHMAEVKAGRALAQKLKPFAVYKYAAKRRVIKGG